MVSNEVSDIAAECGVSTDRVRRALRVARIFPWARIRGCDLYAADTAARLKPILADVRGYVRAQRGAT